MCSTPLRDSNARPAASLRFFAASLLMMLLLCAQHVAFAQSALPVASYNMENGQSGYYTYHDDTYNGSGDPNADGSFLSGGKGQLTDGVLGTDDILANNSYDWIGWYNIQPTITVALNNQSNVQTLAIRTANNSTFGDVAVFGSATVSFSNDGVNFFGTFTYNTPDSDRTGNASRWVNIPLGGTNARYVRVTLQDGVKVGEGGKPWIFVSELQVLGSGQVPIYQNNFNTGATAGTEWSLPGIATAPNGQKFLGNNPTLGFGNETASLNLHDIPAHGTVTVEFDLYILQSWDGNQAGYGPDYFELAVPGIGQLIYTTFATVGYQQTYPDMLPPLGNGGDHPSRTGETASNTLGYSFYGDSIYHIVKTFPHTGTDLTLNFTASNLQGVGDESWGLDNVKVSVDAGALDTFITDGPANGSTIQTSQPRFFFTGYSPTTPTANLTYRYRVDGGAWIVLTGGANEITLLPGLADGLHTFEVEAIDAGGNMDTTPASRTFTVDTTPTSVSDPVVSNVTYNSATIAWQTNKPASGTVDVALAGNSGVTVLSYDDNTIGTSHSLPIGPLKSNTAYVVRVRAKDGTNTVVATSAFASLTTSPFRNLSIGDAQLTVSNPAPADGQSITATLRVKNAGDLPTGATVVFSRVTPSGTTEISRQTVATTPFAANDTTVTSAPFTVAQGTVKVTAQLINPNPGDDDSSDNYASRDVQVGAPGQRLLLQGAEQQTFPGDNHLFAVVVRNTGSQPIDLTNPTITGVSYVSLVTVIGTDVPTTLAPGEQVTLTYRVLTPNSEPGGAPPTPVVRTVTLGLSAFTTTVDLNIYSGPTSLLDVTVIDDQSGAPISGALVASDKSDILYVTGPDGKLRNAENGLPTTLAANIGSLTLYGYAQHYVARSINIDAQSGMQAVTLRLVPGDTLEVKQVTATPLTLQQIQERGVSLTDPANYTIVDFVLYMKIGPVTIPNVVVPISGGAGGGVAGGGTYAVPGGGTVNVQYKINPVTHSEVWIVIPGDVRILKQFWDATVFLHNNSDTLSINGVSATIDVPVNNPLAGIDLPKLNGVDQSQSQSLPNIGPGGVQQARWVIRGNRTGKYRITGTANGTVQIGAASVPLVATLQSDPVEVVIPVVGITFNTPTFVQAGQEFIVGVSVRNESKIDLLKVDVHIKDNQLVNCHLAPGEVALKTVGALAVGEAKTANFRFVSEVTGVVEEVRSFIAPQPAEPKVTVTPLPNRPPFAADDTAATLAGTGVRVNVVPNDSDPDSDTLTVTGATQGSFGTTQIIASDNSILYTPNPGATGQDVFTYTISDGNGHTATATVRVQVNSTSSSPAAISLTSITNLSRVSGVISATVTISNTGGSPASNVVITGSQLGAAATSTNPLPTPGTLAPGASATFTLSYPGTAGAAGNAAILKAFGTFTGGTFSVSKKVTLP